MWFCHFLNLNLYPKLKDNRTVSFFLDVPLLTPLRTPHNQNTMKIQFAYYLTIIAAAAGVNVALASILMLLLVAGQAGDWSGIITSTATSAALLVRLARHSTAFASSEGKCTF
ncbi:hypothetical protein BDR06DRAFT_971595 [Suillus hirtellus]|nr:hypothetical protein BDR06DRAFT_971595 [Suillus hirtellus]